MNDPAADLATALEQTRRSLHGVAELLLAGPQYERTHRIELRVSPGGFATIAEPDLRVDGCDLVAGDRRISLHGKTLAEVGREAGLTARALRDVYAVGPGVDETGVVTIQPEAASKITDAFAIGDTALEWLAPERPRVLWPEHFDVAIDQDEVNFGVSAGDGWCGEPYAYVGPWGFAGRDQADEAGEPFWNAPFGATRTIQQLGDADGVLAFFEDGRRQALSTR